MRVAPVRTDCHVRAAPFLAMTGITDLSVVYSAQRPILLSLRGAQRRGNPSPAGGFFFAFPWGKAIPNLAKFYKTCYNILGAWICAGAASSGRRWSSFGRRPYFCPRLSSLYRRGVMCMVTYSDLFQLGILIVNIITLVLQVSDKRRSNRRPLVKFGSYFV